MSKKILENQAERSVQPGTKEGKTGREPGLREDVLTANEDNSDFSLFPLLQEILRHENIHRAIHQVKSNRGAPGVDGRTIDQLEDDYLRHGETIRRKLREGTYLPAPLRKVEIPKAGGQGIRTLGIPTVQDRMIQQAVLQVLQPIFEPTFSDASFGYRPGRSALDAVQRAFRFVEQGAEWVVDMDLERFFDRVNHDVLMARVARRVKDKRVLRLLRSFLQAGLLEEGLVSPRTEGTPQGSPLSPLLSNILLDDLDKELERRHHRFVRYADDCNIYVNSKAAGERVLASLETFLGKKLRLRINREKSAVAQPQDRKFLGYTLGSYRGKPRIEVAAWSVQRFRKSLGEVFQRGRGRNLVKTIEELNPKLRGWGNYFRLNQEKLSFRAIDGWIRRHLRCLQWQLWKTPANRKRNLERLGCSEESAEGSANRKGPWRNARSPWMNTALSNSYLAALGLVSLVSLVKQRMGTGSR